MVVQRGFRNISSGGSVETLNTREQIFDSKKGNNFYTFVSATHLLTRVALV